MNIEEFAQACILDPVERVGGEGGDQHLPRLGHWNSAAFEIEQRRLIEIAYGRAVAAFDVVGQDVELGLGVDGCPRTEQQIFLLSICASVF